ncbi:hypothetical protein O5472_26200, partial [Escherichia coli]|nr:hypothetical protein [Escherichia coli]
DAGVSWQRGTRWFGAQPAPEEIFGEDHHLQRQSPPKRVGMGSCMGILILAMFVMVMMSMVVPM